MLVDGSVGRLGCAHTIRHTSPSSEHQSITKTTRTLPLQTKMSWFEQLREAIGLYNAGHDVECIALVETILSGPLSPYPRVRCHVLLAYALDDWYEAEVGSVLSSPDISPLCAQVCNFYPASGKACSDVVAIKRHNNLQIRDVSKESPGHIVSRWILSCFSRLLYILIFHCITELCTWEGCTSAVDLG
jgi:hypothetical protein